MNISIPGYDNKELEEKITRLVEEFVMSFVKQVRGSVSAEHGVGL